MISREPEVGGDPSPKSQKPVIIAGAGLVGLALAQALQKEGIPFAIYERDEGVDARSGGWAITLHWVMEFLERGLPKHIARKIRENHVQPEVLDREKVPVIFQNLETGEPKFSREAPVHLRVHRTNLRQILAEGVDVNWGKTFDRFEVVEDGVKVYFEDGSVVEGSMLAATDGKNSRARVQLLGEAKAAVEDLQIGFIGLQLKGNSEQMKAFRTPAPIFWQGCHPTSRHFIFCSMLSTPAANGSVGSAEEMYEVQLNMSWPMEQNAGTKQSPPSSNADKLAKLKEAANTDSGFYPALREAINQIPDDVKVLDIKLEDWPSVAWDNHDGRVTLLGDAAHPMTMYRGQAANHGLFDAVQLASHLGRWFTERETSLALAVCDFETEMIARGKEAVLLSRQACVEAHYYDDLGLDGPLMNLVQKPNGVGS